MPYISDSESESLIEKSLYKDETIMGDVLFPQTSENLCESSLTKEADCQKDVFSPQTSESVCESQLTIEADCQQKKMDTEVPAERSSFLKDTFLYEAFNEM